MSQGLTTTLDPQAPYAVTRTNDTLLTYQRRREQARDAGSKAAGAGAALAALQLARPDSAAACVAVVEQVLAELDSAHQAAISLVNPELAADFARAYEQQRCSTSFQQQ